MTVLLNTIYRSVVRNYPIKLLAGKEGLSNEVRWVHMVENPEISSFLDGQEVVFTTGLAARTSSDLFRLIKENIHNGASGMVVNLGPYVDEITKDMIAYCDTYAFPLFVVPWEVKMARIMKVFSFYIIDEEKKQAEITSALQNAIFSSAQKQLYYPILKQYGFMENSKFTIGLVQISAQKEKNKLNYVKKELNYILEVLNEKAAVVQMEQSFVLLFADVDQQKINTTIDRMQTMLEMEWKKKHFLLAVGSECQGMDAIKISYEHAIHVLKLLQNKREGGKVAFYNELGIYKILFAVQNQTVVLDYIKENVQRLFDYDEIKETNYVEVLTLYLQYNGAVSQVAEELFVHRNTIHYRVSKIEEMLQCNLTDFTVRMELAIALKLKEIY